MYPDVFVKTREKFPNQPHWVIMLFSSIHIPGDERSRTNPGHGYGARSQNVVSYEAYLSEEKFWQAIKDQESKQHGSENYVAFKVEPLTVTKTVSISVE